MFASKLYVELTWFGISLQADQINSLEKEKDFKEEQFDYIQQTLRTIALRCEFVSMTSYLEPRADPEGIFESPDGAGLFFTSHSRPTSFSRLRSYILHKLFSPPIIPTTTTTASLPVLPIPNASASSTSTTATTTKAFSFPYRANVVDRDQILVPSGWDSWGKIKILRDRFDPDLIGKGWELDMDCQKIKKDTNGKGVDHGEDIEDRIDDEGKRIISTVRMYDEVIMDLDGDDLVSFVYRQYFYPPKY